MQTFITYLHTLSPLSPDLEHHLTSIVQSRTFAKKEWIVKPGRACTHLFYIEKGLAGQFHTRDEQTFCCGFLQEADVVLPSAPPVGLLALDVTLVHLISSEQLQWIYVHYPEFNVHGRLLAARGVEREQARLRAFLHRRPAERYRWLLAHAPELILRVSSTHLASYMGMSLETLSRVKSRL